MSLKAVYGRKSCGKCSTVHAFRAHSCKSTHLEKIHGCVTSPIMDTNVIYLNGSDISSVVMYYLAFTI